MIPEVGFHPAAQRELYEAPDFDDLESPGLGSDFLNEVERAMGLAIELAELSRASPTKLCSTWRTVTSASS